MKVNEFLLERSCPRNPQPLSKDTLQKLEALLDKYFKNYNLDLDLKGNHFLDRVNDKRNIYQISACELFEIFTEFLNKYGNKVKHLPDAEQQVIKDVTSNLNIPFIVHSDSKGKDVTAKTIMRKANFATPDKTLPLKANIVYENINPNNVEEVILAVRDSSGNIDSIVINDINDSLVSNGYLTQEQYDKLNSGKYPDYWVEYEDILFTRLYYNNDQDLTDYIRKYLPIKDKDLLVLKYISSNTSKARRIFDENSINVEYDDKIINNLKEVNNTVSNRKILEQLEQYFYDNNSSFDYAKNDENYTCDVCAYEELKDEVLGFLGNFDSIKNINTSDSNSKINITFSIPSELITESKKFDQILKDNQKVYSVKIKSIVDLTKHLDTVKRVVNKYELLDASAVRKSIMQDNPMDFIDLDGYEIYIIDVETAYPISGYILQQELVYALNVPEKFIIVRTANDPLEVENARAQAYNELTDKDGERTSLLSTSSEYDEVPEDKNIYSGNEYNQQFLNYIANKTKKNNEESVYKTGNGLFSWIEDNGTHIEKTEDYNKDIKNIVKPVPYWEADSKAKKPTNTKMSNYSNIDNDNTEYTKIIKTGGKRKTLVTTAKAVRK